MALSRANIPLPGSIVPFISTSQLILHISTVNQFCLRAFICTCKTNFFNLLNSDKWEKSELFTWYFLSVAQNAHHSGDRRFPGQKAWRCECEMHPSAHARSPGTTHLLVGHFANSWMTSLPFQARFALIQYFVFLQPPQYKLDPRLARLLGVHTQTRASIMQALWLYIKNNKLQDSHEKEYINCNRYFRQVTDGLRLRQAAECKPNTYISKCCSERRKCL